MDAEAIAMDAPDRLEEQYPEQIDNQRGDYSSLFGTLSERDLDD